MKILFVVHGYPPTAVAGTEICAERLCVSLRRRGHEPVVFAREEKPGSPEYAGCREERDGVPVVRVVNNFKRLQKRHLYDYHPRIEELFEEELMRTAPDLVHIQHLAGASWGIPGIVKRHGLPLVTSLHDYWYLCERVQLLRPDGGICTGPDGGRSCALFCAHGALSLTASAVIERARAAMGLLSPFPGERSLLAMLASVQRAAMPGRTRRLARIYGDRCRRLLGGLSAADALVAPSRRAREIYASTGVQEGKILVIPHGAPPPQAAQAASQHMAYDGRRPLSLGYVGTIMPHKGITTLLRAVRSLPPDRVSLAMHGRPSPLRFERFIARAVRRFPRGQVALHGTYRPEDLAGILGRLDLLVIPSLWHETFNLVLWEAWAAGVPVIASRVGAMFDFMADGAGGLTFAPGDWRELRGRILEVIREPGMLETLRAPLPRFCIGLDENARRYEEVYIRLTAEKRGLRAPKTLKTPGGETDAGSATSIP